MGIINFRSGVDEDTSSNIISCKFPNQNFCRINKKIGKNKSI